MNDFQEVEILLAEDSDTDAEVTMRALRKVNLGNRIERVKDGAEALDFLFGRGRFAGRPEGLPRLVLLDLKMPRVNGIDVLREIRGRVELRGLPVVMLTSSAEESDIVRSYDLGVNSYVVKPVEFQKLSDEVARLGYYWLVTNRVPG